MSALHEKKYLLDGDPVSARDLINAASDLDADYASDWCQTVSAAACILREHGRTVGQNE